MAVMDAIEEITNALEKKNYAVGIFIDLKKAFDTLNHSMLLKKTRKVWCKRSGFAMDGELFIREKAVCKDG